jgi:hypothetical protein
MLFSDYLDQHAVILALCLAICISSVVVYTKYRTLRAVYLTGASLFTLTATIFLSIGFYLTTLDVSASDRKEIQSIISQVSQDKNIASAIELNQRNMNYWLQYQKKNLTYSDLGSIQYGQVRDTVNLTKYSQYKTLVNAEY